MILMIKLVESSPTAALLEGRWDLLQLNLIFLRKQINRSFILEVCFKVEERLDSWKAVGICCNRLLLAFQ